MIGPFLPLQDTSSHEIVIDVAVTDEVILLTDKEGAIEYYNYYRENMSIILPVESVVSEY